MNAWIEFLKSRNAVLSPPAAATSETASKVGNFGNPADELLAARAGALVCPLLDWTALSVTGADAASFLHGQFTNEVAGLAVDAVHYNGYCSPKGRMLATFPLARTGATEFLLVVPADIAPALISRLRMFVLRAKVTITSLAESHACIGIAGAAHSAPPGRALHQEEGITVLGLPDGRSMAVSAQSRVEACWESVARSATPAGSPAWDWLSISAGIPVITVPTQDKFVPQMLNWELVGGVSFQKGCYPGQEIVARMQYLGKLKERLYRAHIRAPDAPTAAGATAGAPLYGAQFGEQSCGAIINAANAPGGGADVLAVIQIASAQNDQIRLAPAADAPVLDLLPLPYAVPAGPIR